VVGCLAVDLPVDISLFIHESCKDFGATDVNADGKISWIHSSLSYEQASVSFQESHLAPGLGPQSVHKLWPRQVVLPEAESLNSRSGRTDMANSDLILTGFNPRNAGTDC